MKSIVITGSTKGIGFGYAAEFLKRGHNVCIAGRSQADVDTALGKLTTQAAHGARAIGRVCDVTQVDQVQALWEAAHRDFGAVDIWVNNAGFARSGPPFMGLTPDELRAMVDTNVIGTINGSQVAVRGMQAQGHGHIFNTLGGGSDGRVVPGMIGYSTTKRAVKYFTACMADELKGSTVKVGAISPGINVSDGMIRELMALPPAERKKAMWPINVLGDHVETTTPWIVDRVLADVAAGASGTRIVWMTGAKVMGRFLGTLVRKRDVMSRYGVPTASNPDSLARSPQGKKIPQPCRFDPPLSVMMTETQAYRAGASISSIQQGSFQMPQFMVIARDQGFGSAMSPAEMQAILAKYMAWGQALAARGKLVTGNKLKDGEGRVVGTAGGRAGKAGALVTDGPYAESKEVLGGYWILEAATYDEAVALVSDSPHIQFGTLEVRAVETM
ncbi:MAG: SDR family NAD(P)-dependent oxidoreductase [Rhodospirillaceae bacterium]|nr:SDR family NAD(P)-dependent oxidoreductase [Rhodospirillaceae bacterium]